MPTWNRTGLPVAFSRETVGWEWEIRRVGSEARSVRVVLDPELLSAATPLPAVVRNAIRSRGATVVDGYLQLDDPPAQIDVSRAGVAPTRA